MRPFLAGQVRVAIGEQEYRLYEDWCMILGVNYAEGAFQYLVTWS